MLAVGVLLGPLFAYAPWWFGVITLLTVVSGLFVDC